MTEPTSPPARDTSTTGCTAPGLIAPIRPGRFTVREPPEKSAVAHGLFPIIPVVAPGCATVAPRKKNASASSNAELARVQEALRQSEASRRESQAFFERSFNGNPALMSIANAADGRILEVNPSLLRASGYTREEIVGKSTGEIGIWVNKEQREEFFRRLKTDGVVRDLEADFRTKSGGLRSILVNADIIELSGRKCFLTVGIDVTERRRREKIQAATYEISQAVLGSNDLLTLLGKVHQIIGALVPAKNFYVALLNADRSMLSFPYFVDERTPQPPSRPPRNGLTEFVIETRQPLLAGYEEIVGRLKSRGNYSPQGNPSAQWLGAPLVVDDRCFGVITVQDYHNPQAYTDDDMRLMLFVAEQTAAAIHRQQVEAAQREARTYFEKSFHSSPALMAITRVTDGLITEANPAFLRGIGYTRDEVIGRTTFDIGLWANPTQRDDYMRRFREEGAVRDLAAQIRGKSGAVRTLLINADLIELGGTLCALTVGIDITERRRREQVQTATYQISQVVLTGGDLSALFAEVHRIIGGLMPAKNFYVALLSADGSELQFPYFVDEHVPPPEPRPLGNGFTEYVLHTGRPARVTAADLPGLLGSRGPYHPLDRPAAQRLGAPLRVDGQALGVIALQDYANGDSYSDEDLRLLNFVAEQAAVAVKRRQTEAAAARAQRRYQLIFENAVEGLYVTTPEGRFISANPALARILGYETPAELLAAINDVRRQIYVQTERRDDFFALVQRRDEVTGFESEIFRRDGTRGWISESVRVVRNADGTIDHFEGVATDITQKHEAARALSEAKEAADAASRAKSYFLASVSHELRTPLNGILGYTQILRRDAALTTKQRDGVRVIHESADHLLALINDVLDLSKIEAGRIELHPTDFDLPGFAAAIERVFTPRAKEKSILFETAVAADLPDWVRGDEQRLRQVVFNLLSNAVKFTRTGGVVFSVQSLPGADGTHFIRFSVSDTGIGISADDITKLFEPFAQVGQNAGAGTAASGTGLGLAISRSLVERMGGKLNVESKLGWGSRFWFDVALPVVTAAQPPAKTQNRRIVGYEGPPHRVLVVDDNAANRAVMVEMLAPLGFEVVEVPDGLTAVQEAETFQPALILMDLRLPGEIDGLEATRRLRSSPRGPALRIVAVSASAYDLDRSECFAAGCDDFLAKPFREEELWNVVERALALTWRYTELEETRSPFALAMFPPPAAEAALLYELASKGDVVGLRTRAQALIEVDARYAPFAQGVLDLAARFKMKAVRQFVARYIA
ncbi:PAS domain S-box protein [Horticoccus sp. 23ND18S-11]|uniref:PAS domain S-box protein n=1 Tax=Horticoccus sp. 23ND18S-11 TaxID=3391832 RepID=UPI0039C9B636